MRLPEFDIIKGLLIILVIIGHVVSGESNTHTIIFWFHMPVFLMVSGYFLNDSTNVCPWSKPAFNKLFERYFIPYLSWSVLLFVIFHPENILKNIARVLMGGANNALSYSYPFWYINALPVCLFVINVVFYWSRNKYKLFAIVAIIAYIIVHIVDLNSFLKFRLPFSIDASIGCIPYIFVGYTIKRIKFRWWYLSLIIVPIILSFLQYKGLIDYIVDMKQLIYPCWILDIVIPVSCYIGLYGVSQLLAKTSLKYPLCELGMSSITIYFTHAASIYILSNYVHPILVVFISILIGYLIHNYCKRNLLTSLLFLGLNKKVK